MHDLGFCVACPLARRVQLWGRAPQAQPDRQGAPTVRGTRVAHCEGHPEGVQLEPSAVGEEVEPLQQVRRRGSNPNRELPRGEDDRPRTQAVDCQSSVLLWCVLRHYKPPRNDF